eukprot:TRINITY_DN35810_c0_g1_i1.p1 TRINITY_DN35810_c0_g1~~TRINITY_DN35810_c0_g1_i1.p1  ORF type:complete len:897 (+),score=278.90 TRINITY_DN35810_c0_g1_i1:53-2743(+)
MHPALWVLLLACGSDSDSVAALERRYETLRRELEMREEAGRRMTVLIVSEHRQFLSRVAAGVGRLVGAEPTSHQGERCLDGPSDFVAPVLGPASAVRGWAEHAPSSIQWCFDSVMYSDPAAAREAAKAVAAEAILVVAPPDTIVRWQQFPAARRSVLDWLFGLVPQPSTAWAVDKAAVGRLAAAADALSQRSGLVTPPIIAVGGRRSIRESGVMQEAERALASVGEAVLFDDIEAGAAGNRPAGVWGDAAAPLRRALHSMFVRKHLKVADSLRTLRPATEDALRAVAVARARVAAAETSARRHAEVSARRRMLYLKEQALWSTERMRAWREWLVSSTSASVGLLLFLAACAVARPVLAEPVGRVWAAVWAVVGPHVTVAAAAVLQMLRHAKNGAMFAFQQARDEVHTIWEERRGTGAEAEEETEDDLEDAATSSESDDGMRPGLSALLSIKPTGVGLSMLANSVMPAESLNLSGSRGSRGWRSLRDGRAGLGMRAVTLPRVRLAHQLQNTRMRLAKLERLAADDAIPDADINAALNASVDSTTAAAAAAASPKRLGRRRSSAAPTGGWQPLRAAAQSAGQFLRLRETLQRGRSHTEHRPGSRWTGVRSLFAGTGTSLPQMRVSPPPAGQRGRKHSRASPDRLGQTTQSGQGSTWSTVMGGTLGFGGVRRPSALSPTMRRPSTASVAASATPSAAPTSVSRATRAPGPRRRGTSPRSSGRYTPTGSVEGSSSPGSAAGSAASARRRHAQPRDGFEQALLRGSFAPTRQDSRESAVVGTLATPEAQLPRGRRKRDGGSDHGSASGSSPRRAPSGRQLLQRQVTFAAAPLATGMGSLDIGSTSTLPAVVRTPSPQPSPRLSPATSTPLNAGLRHRRMSARSGSSGVATLRLSSSGENGR